MMKKETENLKDNFICHRTVFKEKAVNMLNLREGSVVVDVTLGDGGHFEEIIKRIGKSGIAIGVDWDQRAILKVKRKFQKRERNIKYKGKIIFRKDNFANLRKILNSLKIKRIDAILADLGWRIEQIKEDKYGLGFQSEKLDMRLGCSEKEEKKLTAWEIVNLWSFKELFNIFKKYGQEKYAKSAAREIILARQKKPINSAKELASLLEEILSRFRRKGKKMHPATKFFQALRIVVNNELDNLSELLECSRDVLKKGGRIAVITFHSLEDQLVKNFFRANAGGCVCPKEIPICLCGARQIFKIITKKPIVPSQEEIKKNPRCRSAKMRIAEKIV